MTKTRGKRHSAEQIIKKLREADTMLAVGKTIDNALQVTAIAVNGFLFKPMSIGV